MKNPMPWLRSEVAQIKRDFLLLFLHLFAWRFVPEWCNRSRCHYECYNDPDGEWTVAVGTSRAHGRDRKFATCCAALWHYEEEHP